MLSSGVVCNRKISVTLICLWLRFYINGTLLDQFIKFIKIISETIDNSYLIDYIYTCFQ